jgi:DNA-binding CsgD family transcriptional regulator/tetratricopeptide (TPR) repeat protein
MQLWERSAELELLEDLSHRSASGGRVAVLSGEAGIGKSALVGEFVRRSGVDAWVLWGACDPLVTPRALGPLHDIGQQVGGALRAKLSAGAEQEEIFTASLDALSAPRGRRQFILVVEDAHWADEATLDWLVFLGRRIDRLRGLLIVTYRDDEVGPGHPLHRVLAAWRSGLVARVALPALSHGCVLEQARLAGRDAELVARLGEGNPLLVTELLKADERAVPAAVQDLILDRIQLLSAAARDLAHLVAVVPTRADAPLASGRGDSVAECLGAGVLVAAGDGVAYRHELLRTAVESSLTPVRRRDLHQHVLRVLVDVGGVDPGRLVHHARLAGDGEAVLRYGRIAGEAAGRHGSHREAAAHYRAAAAHADRLAAADRVELLERFAAEAHLAGYNDEALAALEAALTLRETLEQPEAVSEDLRQIAELAWWTGRRDRAREAMHRGMDLLDSAPTSLEVAMAAYASRAQFAFRRHDLTDAIASGERATELAEQLGDANRALHMRVSPLVARLAAGDVAARSSLDEIHREAAARGDIDLAARALLSLASVVADELAQYADAEPLVDRALAFSVRHDLDGFQLAMLSARSTLRLERGDWSGALADADATLAASGRRGVNSILALVARGRIQAARGDPQALATLDEAARAAEGVGDVPFVAPVRDARSEYFLLSGDAERAYEEARRGLDYAAGAGGVPFTVGRLAWRMWRAGGAADEAPDDIALPYRLMIEGEWAKAGEEWSRRGGVYLRTEALASGDEAAAGEALNVLDGLGAVRAAQQLRADLRRRGVGRIPRGPRRATAANSAGLTPREVDVLGLLVDGLSNAEIAQRLTLSSKTVGHYISAVLSKLGVSTRGQAAALARRRNLVP